MKEKVLAITDGIRCAEQKLKECGAQRKILVERLASIDAFIAYQETNLKEQQQNLEMVLNTVQA